MRIACIHIPQFALQCATRVDPSLRGRPVAVVSGMDPGRDRRSADVLHAPIVLACSRAAWALGVRLGMTATAARGLSASLEIVTADAAFERDAVRAVADSLLALTPTVDLGGRVGAGGAHLAMYIEVPAKTRGHSFGERVVALLDDLGFAARIGIADDRFTAWVAAAHSDAPVALSDRAGPQGGERAEHSVVAVPRGGSAAFLAPRPLSLLAITPEVQHMLEALGVRTLGEFASLPAPSVARPFEADYQGLARGDSGSMLRAYAPDAPIREDIIVSAGTVLELDGAVSATAAVALLARRMALRLAGRGRAAVRLEVLAYRHEEVEEIPVSLAGALESAEELAHALYPVLEASLAGAERWRLRATVTTENVVGADGAVTEVFAEGSSPFTRVPANSNADTARPAQVGRTHAMGAQISGAHSAGAQGAIGQRGAVQGAGGRAASAQGPLFYEPIGPRAESIYASTPSSTRRSSAHATSSQSTHAAAGTHPSTLSVVLASTGSLFSLSPPDAHAAHAHARRSEGYRRTRRGKLRRTRPEASSEATAVQPRLFDRVSSK